MSASVDERVVKMQFDNSGFEAGANKAISILEKLKQSLKLDGAESGLDKVKGSVKDFNMDSVSNSVEQCQSKFGAFQAFVAGIFMNLGSKVADFGQNMAKRLTIQGAMDGFGEYETQMKSVQTILSNAGDKLKQQGFTTQEQQIEKINSTLDELNTYADKTIYNFSEMTRNIGTFTAAGVDLDTATTSIQGIANLAAASGSSSQQASTAMYQLSQAIASGTVKLQDWNSVVNAGMGGELFQNALKRTARAHGVAVDDMIAKNGSFRESLQEGWITSDILTETLQQLTMSTEGLTEAEIEQMKVSLENQGYSREDAEAILELANNAQEAATKVRTWTQLWDTVGEAIGSGWAQTWRLIVGDFLEATDLFTHLSDKISGVVNASAESRNAVLADWAAAGGRTALVDGIKFLSDAIFSVIETIGSAFKDVFGVSAEQLFNLSITFKDFAKSLIPSQEAVQAIYDRFKDFFIIIKSGIGIVGNLIRIFFNFAKAIWNGTAPLRQLVGGILSDLFSKFASGIEHVQAFSDKVEEASGSISEFISGAISGFFNFIKGVIDYFAGFGDIIHDIGTDLSRLVSPIGNFLMSFGPIKAVVGWFWSLKDAIGSIGTGSFDGIKNIFVGMKDSVSSFGGAALSKIGTGFKNTFGNAASALHNFVNGFVNAEDKIKYIGDGIVKVFDGIKAKFDAFIKTFSNPKIFSHNVVKAFNGLFDVIRNVFGQNDTGLAVENWYRSNIYEPLGRFFGEFFGQSATWTGAFSKIGKAISGLVDSGIQKLPEPLKTFAGALKNLFDILAEAAGGAITQVLPNITGFFKQIADALSYMSGNIGDETTKMSFNNVVTNLTNLANALVHLKDTIVGAIDTVVRNVVNFFQNLDWDKFLENLKKVGAVLGKGAIIVMIIKFIKSITDLSNTFASIGKGLVDIPKNIGNALGQFGKGFQHKETRAEAILKVAAAIGILALSLLAIASLPSEDLIRAGTAMAIMAGGITALFLIFGALDKLKLIDSGALANFGQAVMGLGVGVLALSGACLLLSHINVQEIIPGLIVVVSLIIACSVFATGLGSNGKSLLAGAAGMVIFAGAIALMGKVVENLGGKDWKTMEDGLWRFAAIIAVLTAFGHFAAEQIGKFLASFLKFGAGILLASIAIGVFAVNFKILSAILGTIGNLNDTIIALIAFFGSFAVLSAITKEASPVKTAAGLLIFAVAVAALGVALKIASVSLENADGLWTSWKAIVGLMAVFGAIALVANGSDLKKAAVSMIIFSAAVGIISLALIELAKTPADQVQAAGDAISVLVAVFAALAGLIEPSDLLKASAAMIIFSAAIGVMSFSLYQLAQVPSDQVMQASAALAILIGIFGLVSNFVNPANLLLASAAMVIFSAGVTVMSFGLSLLASVPANQIWTAVGAIAALTAVMVIAGAIVGIFPPLAAGLIVVAGAMLIFGAGAALFGVGIVLLATGFSMMQSIDYAGLAEGFIQLASSFFELAIATGIMAVAGLVGGAGLLVLSVGMVALSGAALLLAAAITALGAVLTGFDIVGSLAEVGRNAIDGLVQGLSDLGKIGSAVQDIGSKLLGDLKSFLGINSPSTEMKSIGEFSVEGLIEGLTQKTNEVGQSGKDLGSELKSGAEEGLSGLSDIGGISVDELMSQFNVGEGQAQAGGLTLGNAATQGTQDGLAGFSDIAGGPVNELIGQFTNGEGQLNLEGFNLGNSAKQGAQDGIAGLPDVANGSMSDFISQLTGGTEQASAGGNAVGNAATQGVRSGMNSIGQSGVQAGNALAQGISSKSGAVSNASKGLANAAVKALNSLPTQFRTKGTNAGSGFASGIQSYTGSASSAGSSLGSAALRGLGNPRGEFYNIGAYCSQGFADGMWSAVGSARAAGAEIARIAEQAARDKAKVKSPSRVFMKIGEYVGEGFAIGIENSVPMVADSSELMADSAISALSDALSTPTADDLIDTDFNPVITPVINAAEFDSGMSTIESVMNRRLSDLMLNDGINYNQYMASKLDAYTDTNGQLMAKLSDNGIDYDRLGRSVANALITSGVHVELDSGEMLGYIAGEIKDVRRMYG